MTIFLFILSNIVPDGHKIFCVHSVLPDKWTWLICAREGEEKRRQGSVQVSKTSGGYITYIIPQPHHITCTPINRGGPISAPEFGKSGVSRESLPRAQGFNP